MDIRYKDKDYQFTYRVSAVILNKEMNKVLLFKVDGSDYYLLPGGKVKQREESISAIKREINEEIGYNDIDYSFLAVSEEIVMNDGICNQQINMIYLGIYNPEIEIPKLKGLEGDWINFEWVDVKNIDSYELYPISIKEAMEDPNKIYHFIENSCK